MDRGAGVAPLDGMRTDDEARGLREALVHYLVELGDVRTRSVRDALRRVPRHLFAPNARVTEAYRNSALPIGWGQTISQPSVVAMMTEALELKGHERVLEIGTGSGYQAAILSLLASEVFTVEIVAPLGESARTILEELGYSNVHVRIGDGSLGWIEHAPFDRIIVTAAAPSIPKALADQLADPGILVAPIGPVWGQELVRVDKSNGHLVQSTMEPVAFVPLTHDADSPIT